MSPIYVSTENIQQQQQESNQSLKIQINTNNNSIMQSPLSASYDNDYNNSSKNKITITDLPIEIIFHIFTIENDLNYYNIKTPIQINYRGFTQQQQQTTPNNSNNDSIEENINYNNYNKKILLNSIIQFSMTCKYLYYLFQDEGFWYKSYKNYFSNYSLVDIDNKFLSPTLTPTTTTLSLSIDEGQQQQQQQQQQNNKEEKEEKEEDNSIDYEYSWRNRFIKRKHPWNYKAIKCRKEIQQSKGITSLEVDDKYLYSGSHDTNINLYELDNQNELTTVFKGHESTIWALKSDGKRLYSGSNDHTIRIWDLNKKRCKSIIKDTTKIFSIEIKDNMIFSSSDNNIKVWNRKTGKLESTLKGHTGGINKIQIKDHLLFSGSSDGSVGIWDLNTLKPLVNNGIVDCNDKILSLQMINSNTLVTGSQNCSIKFWDLRKSSSFNNGNTPIVSLINAHKWEVWQLEMCGGYLFSGSFDHTIKIWDLNNFKNLQTISSHRSYIHALTSSSFHLFSGSADKFIKVWSAT